MPHIFVTHSLGTLIGNREEHDRFLTSLATSLPVICAEYLGCDDEGGELTKDDFSVTFHEVGKFDIVTHPLEIRVEAHAFPLRLANIDERTDNIKRAIKAGFEHHDSLTERSPIPFYAWVRLATAGFSSGELVPLQ